MRTASQNASVRSNSREARLPVTGTDRRTSPLAFLSSPTSSPNGTPTRSRTSSPLRDGAKSGWPSTTSLVAVRTLSVTR